MKPEFKHKIAYKCKSEEEQDEIRDFFTKIGYEDDSVNRFKICPYILTMFANQPSNFGINQHVGFSNHEEIQSKELFLALACCSNLEEGIEGEYWKYVGETNLAFTKNKLYKATNSLKNAYCFIDDKKDENGFPSYSTCLKNFVKATKEEIEALITPQTKTTMKQIVTITQAKLFQYIQNARKEKPTILPLLGEEFPELWKDEFVVTREFYNKVLKEIGNCPTWVEILKQDFKEFHVLQYEFVKGEIVFASDDCSVFWTICKYHHTIEDKRYVNRLDDSFSTYTYSTVIPVKAVFPQYPYPQLGIHY